MLSKVYIIFNFIYMHPLIARLNVTELKIYYNNCWSVMANYIFQFACFILLFVIYVVKLGDIPARIAFQLHLGLRPCSRGMCIYGTHSLRESTIFSLRLQIDVGSTYVLFLTFLIKKETQLRYYNYFLF